MIYNPDYPKTLTEDMRKNLDTLIMNYLKNKERRMNKLIEFVQSDADNTYTVRNIKERVLQLIPHKITLTRDLSLRLTKSQD